MPRYAAAAEVDYNPPFLNISATNESLASVILAIGKAVNAEVDMSHDMQGLVTVSLRKKSISEAFAILLGNKAYSLHWSQDGKKLAKIFVAGEVAKPRKIQHSKAPVSEKPQEAAFDVTLNIYEQTGIEDFNRPKKVIGLTRHERYIERTSNEPVYVETPENSIDPTLETNNDD